MSTQSQQTHRVLFSLPPIRPSEQTAVAEIETPAQKTVTGDAEIDAVLWLREVISTGQADMIEKAKAAAKRIATPLDELEKRYVEHLRRTQPGNWVASMASIGFADLDGLAASATMRAARQHEALARFGDTLFDETPAERFCIETLARVREDKKRMRLDDKQVDARFDARPDLRPATLSDCLHELTYWTDLYRLRHSVDRDCEETSMQAYAREQYVFRCLGRIAPQCPDEAARVLSYLFEEDCMDWAETKAILFNLVGAPGATAERKQGDTA